MTRHTLDIHLPGTRGLTLHGKNHKKNSLIPFALIVPGLGGLVGGIVAGIGAWIVGVVRSLLVGPLLVGSLEGSVSRGVGPSWAVREGDVLGPFPSRCCCTLWVSYNC